MSLLVVGSVAFDTIKTPYGKTRQDSRRRRHVFFAVRQLLHRRARGRRGGRRFHRERRRRFDARKIDISGITHEKGQSFFWSGEYGENVNEAKTLDTQLDVFGNFDPQMPARLSMTANIFFWRTLIPCCRSNVRKQMPGAKLVGGDTMNYWINGSRQALGEMMKNVDALLINDTEAKMLAGDPSLARAAQKILEMGPEALVIKHGEYGATVFFRDGDRLATGRPSVSRARRCRLEK